MKDDIEPKDWEADSVDLRQIWNVIDRRKWHILIFVLAVTSVAFLLVKQLTPVYKASATILIESDQANVVSIEEVYGLNSGNQQYYDTQFEILRSRPVAETAVRNLNLMDQQRTQQADADEDAGILDKLLAAVGLFSDGDSEVEDPPTFAEIVDWYRGSLSIEPIGSTQLVDVYFESPNPTFAADAANAHANAYIESILDARLEVTQSASSWMAKRIEDLRTKLLESERQLQAYREQEGLIDAEGVQSLPAKEIDELTTELVDARRRLSSARIAYQQVRQAGAARADGNLENVPAILRDEAVGRFREAEAEAEQKVAELAKRYGPKHPTMIAARSELDKATENVRRQQTSLASTIEAEYRAAQSDVDQLQRELDDAKSRFQEVGRKESRLAELARETDVNRQLYDMFYNRMKETAQTDDLESVNARLMSPAIVPADPFKPKTRLILILVIAVSGIVAVSAALIDDSMNNTVRSSNDVEEKLELPLLGMLPLLKNRISKDPRVGHAFFDETAGEFSEAIRTVRTGLTLSSLDTPYKVILVTSAVSGEGKSTTAMNLAYAFGQVERVLLIDADMRRPSVAKELKIQRSHPGITALLAGTSQPQECILNRGRENLDILATGFIPPNPLELLSSRRLGELLAGLRTSYDRIIIDSPPVLPVSDAVVLSLHADAIVFVVKSDRTSVHQIRNGVSKLQRFGAPVAGIVLNQLDVRKAEKYGDYGYGGYYESYDSDKSLVDPSLDTKKKGPAAVWANPKMDRREKVS